MDINKKMLVFGSRDVNSDLCLNLLKTKVQKLKPSHILTAGEPDGVCKVAQIIAKEAEIPLTLFFKQISRNAGMYHHRSVQALKECDYAIFFYNGVSKGTKNEIDLAIKMNINHEIILIEKNNNETYGWGIDDTF